MATLPPERHAERGNKVNMSRREQCTLVFPPPPFLPTSPSSHLLESDTLAFCVKEAVGPCSIYLWKDKGQAFDHGNRHTSFS